jgi:hypothetical protein
MRTLRGQATSEEALGLINDLAARASAGHDVGGAAKLVELEILNGIYAQLERLANRLEARELPILRSL